MKILCKGACFVALFLQIMFFLLVLRAECAEFAIKNEQIIVRGDEELVARDVVIIGLPVWCGPDALLHLSENAGIFRHDVETGRKVQVTEWVAFPEGCTPDGKWVIYTELLHEDGDDIGSSDVVKHVSWEGEDANNLLESINLGEFGEKTVTEVWRYEIETGRRQRIGVKFADEVMGVAVDRSSPERVNVFLGREPETKVEMPDPKWEVVWSLRKQGFLAAAWFPDYSANVHSRWDEKLEKMALDVEVYSPRRELFTLYHEADDIAPLSVDDKGRVYVRAVEADDTLVERCAIDIDKHEMSCDRPLDVRWRPDQESVLACHGCSEELPKMYFMNYHFLADGKGVLFASEHYGCIRHWKFGEPDAMCITGLGYDVDSVMKISPDERWVAFRAIRDQESTMGWQSSVDFYVIKIKRD